MPSRRHFLKRSLWVVSGVLTTVSDYPSKWMSLLWAKGKRLLPKGFPKDQIIRMNPAEIDPRNLDLDPLKKFGTMGATDVSIDPDAYQLKIRGEVNRPLAFSYSQILRLPSTTEDVLLICPGFFANHGRWTGVHLKTLLQEAQVRKEAKYVEVKGYRKSVRIQLEEVLQRKILLAYRVNDEPLPQRHGYPLRLVYEDAYGDDWIKYVDELVVAS